MNCQSMTLCSYMHLETQDLIRKLMICDRARRNQAEVARGSSPEIEENCHEVSLYTIFFSSRISFCHHLSSTSESLKQKYQV